MHVLLLGPVAISLGGEDPQHLPGSKQSALLAALALAAGQVIDRDDLVDLLWGASPPSTARNTLQAHVSAVRRLVGADVVERVGSGYRLSMPASAVDALELSAAVERAQEQYDRGEHATAARILQAALSSWRGTPFPELTGERFDAERQRLERLRDRAEDLRLDADLALGRHRVVLDDLQRLAETRPLDEGVAERLMIALYRSGRQHDSLAAYARIRAHLTEGLGVEPGPALRQLHVDVLNHACSLDVPETVLSTLRPWRGGVRGQSGRLVGRDALLHALLGRLRPGLAMTMVGPAGVGKSALGEELLRRAQASWSGGGVLVDGSAVESAESLWSQVLDRLDADQRARYPHEARALVERGDVLLLIDDPRAGSPALDDVGRLVEEGEATVVITAPRPTGIEAEEVVPVPALDTVIDGAAVELLLARARAAGAEVGDDVETREWARRCAELVEGMPLALELIAPAAGVGFEQLAEQLQHESVQQVGGVATSFASSLDKLEDGERRLLDGLVSLHGPVDLQVLQALTHEGHDAGAVPRTVASLVRDGLVRRSPGTHGQPMFSVLDSIADEVKSRQDAAARRGLCADALAALATSLTEDVPWLGPAFASTTASQRALAHLDATSATLAEAREHVLVAEAAPLAVLATVVLYGQRGVEPDPDRFDWMLESDDLDRGLRYGVSMAAGHAYASTDRLDRMRAAYDDALRIAREVGDSGWVALTIAHANLWAVITGAPLLRPLQEQQDALAEVEDPLQRAAALGWGSAALADVEGLSESLRQARLLGHQGLQMYALINIAEVGLEQGTPEDSIVSALEAAGLATRMHQEFLVTAMNATATSARAIAGDRPSLDGVARMVGLAVETDDLRSATLGLLKLAAGAAANGHDDLAAECIGAYEAMRARQAAEATEPEKALRKQYLDAFGTPRLEEPLDEALPRLLAAFGPQSSD